MQEKDRLPPCGNCCESKDFTQGGSFYCAFGFCAEKFVDRSAAADSGCPPRIADLPADFLLPEMSRRAAHFVRPHLATPPNTCSQFCGSIANMPKCE
jgi:hypothetical protein